MKRSGGDPSLTVEEGAGWSPYWTPEADRGIIIFIMEPKKSLNEVCPAMEPSVEEDKFGVMASYYLKETRAMKGAAFTGEIAEQTTLRLMDRF